MGNMSPQQVGLIICLLFVIALGAVIAVIELNDILTTLRLMDVACP